MSEKVEGTIVLDGLIEGQLPDDGGGADENLQQWVQFVGKMGLRFNFESAGNAFSMLPDNRPVSCQRLGADPEDAIRQAIEQLVQVLPEPQQRGVFSTLRSSEYRKDEEVQSLYAVGPDGKVQVESRSVEAKTVAPVQPLSTKQKLRLGAFGILIAAAVFGIAMLFPPVRQMFSNLTENITPVSADDVKVDASAFEDYFTVEKKQVAHSRTLILTLKRTDAYPTDAKAIQAAYERAGSDLEKRLVVEAIAHGYVTIEVFGDEGKYYLSGQVRIRGFAESETIEVRIPVRNDQTKNQRVGSVKLTY